MVQVARRLPEGQRRYDHMCNQGTCYKNQYLESGYCKYHCSKEYADLQKIWQKIAKWVAIAIGVLVILPLALAVTASFWKMALAEILS